MLTDLLCWFKYGRTRFGLMEYYGISLVYNHDGPHLNKWYAGTETDIFNCVGVVNRTPYGALITCVELIESGKL